MRNALQSSAFFSLQDTAQNAFKFCIKYQRKTEFRKLCDNLRLHLGHVTKHQNQASAINLNNPDSQVHVYENYLFTFCFFVYGDDLEIGNRDRTPQ